jgi:hypothetical protein
MHYIALLFAVWAMRNMFAVERAEALPGAWSPRDAALTDIWRPEASFSS